MARKTSLQTIGVAALSPKGRATMRPSIFVQAADPTTYTRAVRRARTGWVLRVALPVIAFVLAFVAFRSGVGVTDRVNIEHEHFLAHTYYSLGLFVLGGLDLGLPIGGPEWARAMLWVAYFFAPIITTSAVAEGAFRLLQPDVLRRWSMSDHVIIFGFDHLGMLFLDSLKDRDPKAKVLVVDREPRSANVRIARNHGAVVMAGDARSSRALSSIGIDRAKAVVLMTGDDLANLEAAWRIANLRPDLPVTAHVSDLGLWRSMEALKNADAVDNVRVFNAHRIAARKLYEQHLADYFSETVPRDVVVLVGFGRFGQTILEYLQERAGDEIQRAVVVDMNAARQVRLYKAQVQTDSKAEIREVEGDVDDPGTWDRVEDMLAGLNVEPVFVMGTDDDQRNLRAAITLRASHPGARIFVRCVYESAFSGRLSQQLRFDVLAVNEMLRAALRGSNDLWE